MKNLDFEWLTDEFMLYCRSTQLREKTMSSYEQTLHLFGRWLSDELKIYTVDKITENVKLLLHGPFCDWKHQVVPADSISQTVILHILLNHHRNWEDPPLSCFLFHHFQASICLLRSETESSILAA